MQLYKEQLEALNKMRNGCILCGGVGSGKSITSLSYFYVTHGGDPEYLKGGEFEKMTKPKDLYIITTAKKRDNHEWDQELIPFHLYPENVEYNNVHVVIDSWNNVKKYAGVKGAFFIFDEQHVTGKGAWVRAFLKIAKVNEWILLSATPGDTWNDYGPVFVANGFYSGLTEFRDRHIIYNRWNRWQIEKYLHEGILEKHRRDILVMMGCNRHTERHYRYIECAYDKALYKQIQKTHWNPWKEEPYSNAAGLCYGLRRVVSTHTDRVDAILDIMLDHERVIIFYNFPYEKEIIEDALSEVGIAYAEWNGQKHEPLPDWDRWAYLVQYGAGAEGWNCISSDCVIFYSQNYSYKIFEQCCGRIDRVNTPYKDLYYYILISSAPIDVAIRRCIRGKKKFNERNFCGKDTNFG